MPKARKHLISLEATSYYHCVSRCVRRAFLCGYDTYSDTSYEHRRQWVEDRILELGSVMCVEVLAYAVMSNHLHVVLRADAAEALSLTNDEVIARWHQLYLGTTESRKYVEGLPFDETESARLEESIATWRERLFDISWFMRALNEPIARQANLEDKCTGKFWESRFKSQALVGDEAILSCMVYVDLNPVRAKMAEFPEESDYTSIKKRIRAAADNKTPEGLADLAKSSCSVANEPSEVVDKTASTSDQVKATASKFKDELPITLASYIELVDATGRLIKENKRGAIDRAGPPILERLGIQRDQWKILATQFESRFKHIAGTKEKLTTASAIFGLKRRPGLSAANLLFG